MTSDEVRKENLVNNFLQNQKEHNAPLVTANNQNSLSV